MMKETQTLGFDKLSNLKDQLRNLEAKHTGPDGIEIRQSREVLLGAIGTYDHSRYQLGRALRAYKAHFKVEHGWVAAAKIIALPLIEMSERYSGSSMPMSALLTFLQSFSR